MNCKYKFKAQLFKNRCVFAFLGLLIVTNCVSHVSASPVAQGTQQNGFDLGGLFGNIFGDLKNVFQQQPQTTTTTTTTTTTPTPVTTKKPTDFLGSILNLIPGVQGIVKDVQSIADSFLAQPTTTTTTTTTTPKPTSPVDHGLFGNIFGGIGDVLNGLMGKKQPQPVIQVTTTTVAPPPGGRGIQGIIYNIENIIQNILGVKDAFLSGNYDWYPGKALGKVRNIIGSVKSLNDIYLQRNLQGGIGEVINNTQGVINEIGSMGNTVQQQDPGKLIKLIFSGNNIIQKILELHKELFAPIPSLPPEPKEHPPSIFESIANLIQQNNSSNSSFVLNRVQWPASVEFKTAAQHIFKILETIGEITTLIQQYHPDNPVLQFAVKIKSVLDQIFNNKTLDKENILDIIQHYFPGGSLSQSIASLGSYLKQLFPKVDIAQSVGNILQQEMLVNFAISNVAKMGNNILSFGNVKDSLLQTAGDVGNGIFKGGISSNIMRIIEMFETLAVSSEDYLKMSHKILDQFKLNTTEGHLVEQIISKIPQVLSQSETREFLFQTVIQFINFIPREIFSVLSNIVLPIVQNILTGGPIRRNIIGGGPIRQAIFLGGPLRRALFLGQNSTTS